MQRVILIASLTVLLTPASNAQCDDWLEGFNVSANSSVWASAVWNSGGVDRLVLAVNPGPFGDTFGAGVVVWDGQKWDNLAGGLNGAVRAVAAFDYGSGSNLYAAGSDVWGGHGGLSTFEYIHRWNGSSWSVLVGELGPTVSGTTPHVTCMKVFDDGSGPALYVGGRFGSVGGMPVTNVARWNGSSWSSVGNIAEPYVHALEVFDDGGGAKLYAGGSGAGLFVWNGVSWSAIPGAPNSQVRALAALDLGAGERLFVGGDFMAAGGVSASRVASWDGTNWTTYGAGRPGTVLSFAAYDTGAGVRLVAGGEAGMGDGPNPVAEWNGSTWNSLGGWGGYSANAKTLHEFRVGVQRVLVAGGSGLRYWFQGQWRTVDSAPTHVPRVLVDYDDGAGASAISISAPPVGTPAVGKPVVWKRQQEQWTPVPGSPCGVARALTKFDNGSGERVFVGGKLETASGALANDVQVYNGSTWSPVGAMPNFDVYDLEWFDAGSGPRLYAAGKPHTVNSVPTIEGFVICWDGVNWSAIGGPDKLCVALENYDDGSGTKLYAGGEFWTLFPSTSSRGIAKWNGATWSVPGPALTGVSGTVEALVRWNDGSGEKLYIGGKFDGVFGGAPGVPNTSNIASWDGVNFAPLGPGWSPPVTTLAVDSGTTPSTLIAGGSYWALPGSSGARERGGLMRWNGSAWSHYAGGLTQNTGYQPGIGVTSVVVADLGDGVDLLVTGVFRQLGDTLSPGFGVWNRCAGPGEPYCFGSGADTICACLNASPVQDLSGCVNSSGRAALLRGDGSASIAQNDLSLRTHGMPPAKSCILFVGTDATNNGHGGLLDDGLRCAGGAVRRLGLRTSDAQGFATWGPGLNTQGGWLAGQTRYLQTWYRDPAGPCGRGSNLSNGYRVVLAP